MWPPGFARWIRFNSCRVSLIPFRWMHCTEQYSAGVTSSTDGYACTCTVQYSTYQMDRLWNVRAIHFHSCWVCCWCDVLRCTVLTACFFCLAVQQRERKRQAESAPVPVPVAVPVWVPRTRAKRQVPNRWGKKGILLDRFIPFATYSTTLLTTLPHYYLPAILWSFRTVHTSYINSTWTNHTLATPYLSLNMVAFLLGLGKQGYPWSGEVTGGEGDPQSNRTSGF